MPEEINRRLTDHLSTYLLTTSRDANDNLAREGIPAEKVHLVGNTMIDTLLRFRERARERLTPERLGLDRYAVLTLHRPDNVDSYDDLERIVETVQLVGRDIPVVFPVHPRTRAALAGTPLERALQSDSGVRLTEPLGYLDFLSLVDRASVVLTDSGGIQEETTVLGVPCVTLRESTERPVTVTSGTNVVVGTDPEAILRATRAALAQTPGDAPVPELWDGRAAERIVAVLQRTAVEAAAAARV
jgi:UDP-N-acetylglucosamine 2-epimerase (non-hydrolysing)